MTASKGAKPARTVAFSKALVRAKKTQATTGSQRPGIRGRGHGIPRFQARAAGRAAQPAAGCADRRPDQGTRMAAAYGPGGADGATAQRLCHRAREDGGRSLGLSRHAACRPKGVHAAVGEEGWAHFQARGLRRRRERACVQHADLRFPKRTRRSRSRSRHSPISASRNCGGSGRSSMAIPLRRPSDASCSPGGSPMSGRQSDMVACLLPLADGCSVSPTI